MKTLKEQFEEILFNPHIAPGGKIGHKAVIIQLLQSVKERDAFVIGANEKSDFSEKTDKFPYQIRNQVKVRQRKRAEESL